jgi:16S rRNA G527 N7-methylase RsmG
MSELDKILKHDESKDSLAGNLLSLLTPTNWKINLMAPREQSRVYDKSTVK